MPKLKPKKRMNNHSGWLPLQSFQPAAVRRQSSSEAEVSFFAVGWPLDEVGHLVDSSVNRSSSHKNQAARGSVSEARVFTPRVGREWVEGRLGPHTEASSVGDFVVVSRRFSESMEWTHSKMYDDEKSPRMMMFCRLAPHIFANCPLARYMVE